MKPHDLEVPVAESRDGLGELEYWACARPEAFDPNFAVFHLDCRPCRISLHVAVTHVDPEAGLDVRTTDDPEGVQVWAASEIAAYLNGAS